MISEFALPAVQNPFGTEKFQNVNLFHAEDAFKTLEDVYKGNIHCSSHMMSLLANTMELFEKGIILELHKLHPENVRLKSAVSAISFTKDHEFVDTYVREIHKYIPISNSYDGTKQLLKNYKKIQGTYSKSRYHDFYEKTDFDWAFGQFSRHRERMFRGLEQEVVKVRMEQAEELAAKKAEEKCPFDNYEDE